MINDVEQNKHTCTFSFQQVTSYLSSKTNEELASEAKKTLMIILLLQRKCTISNAYNKGKLPLGSNRQK